MSAFVSDQAARAVWEDIRQAAESRGQQIRAGSYIAEVVLEPDSGFDIEDLGEPDGHLTIWGDPSQLAARVVRIYPAATLTD
jgi:class 3 adenylate cyclase